MINLSFVKDKHKTIVGTVSIILCAIFICIILFVFKPLYVEWYMLILLIPAVGLIISKDSIKNSHILGVITFGLVILVFYLSFNGYSNTYHTLTNLYLTSQINHVPTSSEISSLTNTYGLMMFYAGYNILCGIMYFIPTTTIKNS